MSRIRQLPNSVVTKIAAGEVIERPASVVKELLENAVDAGSQRIDIEIEQGGIERIFVADDGHGIHADDLPLAFANHATSKLASADDLFRIETMGFRGEALASIGSVSRVALQSRFADLASGAELHCHGGELSPVKAWNGAVGTRIEVKHLFYNVPVRRKFLRTPGTELGHVTEVFTRLALAQTGLHLTLRHNGKPVHEIPAQSTLRDRIGLFFGDEVKECLYEIKASGGPADLHGFIADPSCDRGNARMQYLFLNGRWIRDRSLSHALQEGYRGLLMTGRYAVAFLFLDLPPELVDVNVHPTKAEVRFRDAHALYGMLLSAVKERLRAENLTPKLQVPVATGHVESESWFRPPTPPPAGLPYGTTTSEPAWFRAPPPLPSNLPFSSPSVPVPVPLPVPGNGPGVVETQEDQSRDRDSSGTAEIHAINGIDSPRVLQLYDAYLVIETPEGMLVIDQHALHERILFEVLKTRTRSGTLETQRLLIPEPIELPAEQAALVLEQRDALAELGLGIEDFGGNTIVVTQYPAILGNRTPQTIARAVIDHLVNRGRLPSREVLLNDLMAMMACKAAVKAGDRLTSEQIAALVAQRHLVHDPHHCPHGRPTSLLLSKHELDRQFGRV